MELVGELLAVFWVFLFGMAILWTILPFAIFGMKPILLKILGELLNILDELKKINSQKNREEEK